MQSQQNAEGDTQLTVYTAFQVGAVYEASYRERNTCGWGPPVTCRLETINCDGGYDPFRMAQGPTKPKVKAYPNPAYDDLTLEQGGGPVRLFNAFGQPVRSLTAKPGRLHLDTSRLPTGLYYLEMRSAGGTLVRQQIRVEH